MDYQSAYKTIMDDHFTPAMEIAFIDGDRRQTLRYEKVAWVRSFVPKEKIEATSARFSARMHARTTSTMVPNRYFSFTP